MTYSPSELTVEAYSKPLFEALGSFFSVFSEDSWYYLTLCRSLVACHETPWNILELMRLATSPQTSALQHRWPSQLCQINQSDTRVGTDGKRRAMLPTGITSVQFIQDSPSQPTVLWATGVDFDSETWGTDLWLVFNQDPFDSDLEVSSTLNSANEIEDQQVTLWLRGAASTAQPANDQWGSALRVSLTDEDSRDAATEVLKSLSTGPTLFSLMLGAGRAYGHPVCEVDGEVVQYVTQDRRGKLVITDESVYRYPPAATITVNVGDTLVLGQSISSAILWYNVNRGTGPDVPGWAIAQAELGNNYQGSLVFPNEDKALVVTTVADKTKVETALGGSTQDQDTFWAEVHTRGVSGGRTLAQSLDTRANPVGEPTAADLPATLNPYQLLVSEAFRYSSVVCLFDFAQTLNPEGPKFMAAWQNAMPAHQTIRSYCRMSVIGGVAPSFTSGSPQFGLVFTGSIGYYGLGSYTSAGGEPAIAQEA